MDSQTASATTPTLRIFISSPGDVAEEREKVRQVIALLQTGAFVDGLPGTLEAVGERLRSGMGPVGRSTEFIVHDPKERLISAPCFEDRVLHHAVLNVCEPVLERYQISDSYACRVGKGQFAAIERACPRNSWIPP